MGYKHTSYSFKLYNIQDKLLYGRGLSTSLTNKTVQIGKKNLSVQIYCIIQCLAMDKAGNIKSNIVKKCFI